jgi:hypothetical protein
MGFPKNKKPNNGTHTEITVFSISQEERLEENVGGNARMH